MIHTRDPQPQRPGKKRRWRKLLVSFPLGILLACLLMEVLVLLFYGEQVKFPRHVVEAPWGLRYNEPGAKYRHKSADGTWQFRINQQGMRADREFSYEKPQGVKRIIAVGDSMCIGYEVDVKETFATVIERELKNAGVQVEVLNAGVSGYSTAEAALYLERELLKYEPDLVVSSFHQNDLTDNVRSGLLVLDGEKLVQGQETYVPAGRVGNFLNTNWFFNLLSERSNAFAFAKERVTMLIKRSIVETNEKKLEDAARAAEASASAANEETPAADEAPYEDLLLAAIVERMYQTLRAKDVPLVILTVPNQFRSGELLEMFPVDLIDLDREGLEFVSGQRVLAPHAREGRLLFRERSHNHWTPLGNEVSGKAIADLILKKQLLN